MSLLPLALLRFRGRNQAAHAVQFATVLDLAKDTKHEHDEDRHRVTSELGETTPLLDGSEFARRRPAITAARGIASKFMVGFTASPMA